jgi:hypothetical protein
MFERTSAKTKKRGPRHPNSLTSIFCHINYIKSTFVCQGNFGRCRAGCPLPHPLLQLTYRIVFYYTAFKQNKLLSEGRPLYLRLYPRCFILSGKRFWRGTILKNSFLKGGEDALER